MVAWLAAAALLIATGTHVPAQQAPPTSDPTIRGIVIDGKTGSPIADAKVTLVEISMTTQTGPDGRFGFAHVPPRTYTLTVTTIGYIFVRRRIVAGANTNLELIVPLAEGTGTYQETVDVSADATSRPKAIGVSSQIELGSAALADLRGVATDDPIRAIQSLPGVATGDDFQAAFSVRGSAFRHVGIVMDGTPTQLLLHAVRGTNESGSVSMINSDVLSRAGLFGGPHARQHGDWLGATLEFDVREGSRDRLSFRGAVSGTSASGVVEGPIGSTRRGSWIVSIRRSYLDWLVRKIEPSIDSTIGFTDLQAKATYDLTSRQQVQFLAIAGDASYRQIDASPTNGLLRARSRSALNSVAWRFAHSRAVVTQRLSVIHSDFRNTGLFGQVLAKGSNRSVVWRGDAIVPAGRGWTIEGGSRVESLYASENLKTFQSNGQGGVRVRFQRTSSASTVRPSGWGQASWRGTRAAIAAGLRVTGGGDAAGMDQSPVLLPWLLGEISFGTTTIRGGVGRSAQFLDPVMQSVAPGPMGPERATSFDLGIDQAIARDTRIQLTAFHRDERDIFRRAGEDRLDPVTGLRIPEATFPVISPTLTGTSRGFDVVLMRRGAGGLSGWIGYSWARTRYHDRLTGEDFDGDFDQRHTINVFAQQRLSYRMTVSGKLRVGSNVPLVGYFQGDVDALRLSAMRNQVRLPMYARLDVRANRTFTFERSRLTLFVEVMNVLGRHNLRQTDGSIRANLTATGFTDQLIPRVPSAGILFEF